ncbi:MAG: hypothetical protein ACJ8EW_26715 [Rhizobium sp.]|nr:hypothetical protein [Rhizobium leguminosarum]MBY5404053.1 hypothetical protein [Rhizobium leguminosarum]
MLVHNLPEVLKRAWSVRLMALALLFITIEPFYSSRPPPGIPQHIYI